MVQTVLVRGADGVRKPLAFVRQEDGVVYVCAKARYAEAISGSDDPVVGFPVTDVEGLDNIQPQHASRG